jgi:Ca2+-binding EF-hand superfamily protein
MTFRKLALMGFAAAALVAPALAQPAPPTPEEQAARFVKADADKNGKLSFAEWKTSIPPGMADQATDEQLQGFFKRRDKDGDGSLSKEEFTAPMQRPQ